MRRTVVATLVSLLTVSVCVPSAGQQPRKIEFRMQPGESLTYAMDAETTTEYVTHRSRGRDKRTMKFRANMQIFMRCIDLSPEGVVSLEISYPDFMMETIMAEGGQTSRIVSDAEGAKSYVNGKLQEQLTWQNLEERGRPNLKKLFGSLIGVSIDSSGKVVQVKAPSDFTTRFSWVDVKDFFRQQVILPKVPIAPGAEWSDSSEKEVPRGPGPLAGKVMLNESKYKYEKNETVLGRECARISIVVTGQPMDEVPQLDEFKQINEGWSLISLDRGHLVSSEMTLFQEMKGTPQGLKTEVKTTGKVTTNLVQPSAPESDVAEEKPSEDGK